MSDDADYEPALDAPSGDESSPEADPVVRRDAPAATAEAKIGAIPDDAVDDPGLGPRAPRVRSAKNRAMFQAIVKAGGVGEETELEPMGTVADAAPAPAPVAAKPAPAAPAPAAVPSAAPAAPVTPPPGLPELPDLPLPASPAAAAAAPTPDAKHAEREAQLTAREAAMAEREKLLPDALSVVERPAPALVEWLKRTQGISDDAEMKMALTDLVTELSEIGLGVTLPAEVKTALESRRAVRSVKAYKATIDREKASLSEQRTAQEKAAAEARAAEESRRADAAYVARIGELIAPAKAQHQYLHDAEITGGAAPQVIVYEVMKEQRRLADEWKQQNPGQALPAGMGPSLATAAEYANNFYRQKAEAIVTTAARIQTRLAPTAPAPKVATPAVVTSPGGAPGPAPKSPPPAEPTMEWDPSDLPMDRQQRRQAGLRRLVQATKSRQANGA